MIIIQILINNALFVLFIIKLRAFMIVGFSHLELAIASLIDIIHAFTVHSSSYISLAVTLYMQMLMAKVKCNYDYLTIIIIIW